MGLIGKLLAVVVFAPLSYLALVPLAAAIGPSSSPFVFAGCLALIAALAFLAPTARRAWGRGALVAGALFLAMPFGATALAARAGQQVVAETSAEDASVGVVGATLAGGAVVGASMFIGFIVGAILIILGLVLALGGRREVIVVERAAPRREPRL